MHKFLVFILCLTIAITGCGNPPVQEQEDPPTIPVSEPKKEPEKEKIPPGFYKWEIVDKRIDKIPLNGKYLLDVQPWTGAPDGWAEQFYFEIFDDYIFLSDALISRGGVAEIDQLEGTTWICFIDSENRFNPLNFYLYKPGVFVKETIWSDLYNEHSNEYSLTYKKEEILLEERQKQDASETEKALLEFDPSTFYLDKTFGEVRDIYPDLQYCGYESGSTVFHSVKEEKYFRISAGWSDEPPAEMEIVGFGASAKTIFPNMGAWVFKEEVRRVADTFFGEGYYRLYFTYQGYGFYCEYEDSFDISPNTLVMVYKLKDEDE